MSIYILIRFWTAEIIVCRLIIADTQRLGSQSHQQYNIVIQWVKWYQRWFCCHFSNVGYFDKYFDVATTCFRELDLTHVLTLFDILTHYIIISTFLKIVMNFVVMAIFWHFNILRNICCDFTFWAHLWWFKYLVIICGD